MSHIIPVHKKNDKCSFNNYRPVSLLPICRKCFEGTIFNNVFFYFLKIITYLLLINQVLDLMTHVSISLCQLCTVFIQILIIIHHLKLEVIFLTFLKHLIVWHDGLLYKLESFGISGNLLKLFHSYLNNRQQRVVFNGQYSKWAPILAGVPQGSILGPLLFLIYINDLPENLKSSAKLLFYFIITELLIILRISSLLILSANKLLLVLKVFLEGNILLLLIGVH